MYWKLSVKVEVVVFVCMIYLLGAIHGCTMEQIKDCKRYLTKSVPKVGHVFISIEEPDFSDMCREVDRFEKCVTDFIDDCDFSHRMTISNNINRVHNICHQGKEVYLRNAKCLADDELNRKAKACMSTNLKLDPIKTHEKISNPEVSTAIFKENICRRLEESGLCLYDEVDKVCGEEAAHLEKDIMQFHYSKALEWGGCTSVAQRGKVDANICSENVIRDCQHKHLISSKPSKGYVFITMENEEFLDMCGELDAFEACVNPIIDRCDEMNKILYHDTVNRVHFMCNDGKQAYLKHSSCFKNPHLNKNASYCLSYYGYRRRIHIHKLMTSSDSEQGHVREEMCSDWELLKMCINTSVEAFCGKEAAAFEVKGIMDHTYHPSVGKTCINGIDKIKWISVGCTCGLVFILSIALIVMIRLYLKRRKSNDETPMTFDNPLENAFDMERY